MNIRHFTRGWFVGDFDPSVYRADFEVMFRNDKKGLLLPRHFHKKATEYNLVARGKYRIDDVIYDEGDIFINKPYHSSDCECLKDGAMLCVKDKSIPKDKFMGSVLNIVIPAAGRASRFFNVPKPLIPIGNKTMIERVVENLRPKREHRFIFICLKDHRKGLEPLLKDLGTIIWIDEVTEGAACTILKAKDLINNNDPLLISDCDQFVEMDLTDFYNSKLDVTMLTKESDDPNWSYARLENDRIVETAEKTAISNHASVGKHLFKHGKYFVEAAEKMIEKGIRTKNEFYVSPCYNEMLDKNMGIYPCTGHWDVGNPENLKKYLERK
jgi:choline kinase